MTVLFLHMMCLAFHLDTSWASSKKRSVSGTISPLPEVILISEANPI